MHFRAGYADLEFFPGSTSPVGLSAQCNDQLSFLGRLVFVFVFDQRYTKDRDDTDTDTEAYAFCSSEDVRVFA